MATAAAEARASEKATASSSSSMVIVELDEPQSSVAVKRLRKGKGTLYKSVEQIVKDLTEEGTIKSGAQPVVIIVQEIPAPPWAFDDDED
jgi:Family of unknown function (DUF6200)